MVSGKPYISVNIATTNAENPPKARQSSLVLGWTKLAAKTMNTKEFRATNHHKPYPYSADIAGPFLIGTTTVSRSTARRPMPAVTSMASMAKEVHHEHGRPEHIR